MKKDEVWEKIKNDKSVIYGQSMLDVFLQTTNVLKLDHYLQLNDKQKKLINADAAYKVALRLYELSKQKDPILEKIIKKEPEQAYIYASRIIKNRWPEAEEYIKKDPYSAYLYALDVIKGRWKEAEEYIKNSEYAYLYAKDIIEDRWPEAEEYIKQNPYDAYLYAKDIIEDRWPEAEDIIKKSQYWKNYKNRFGI